MPNCGKCNLFAITLKENTFQNKLSILNQLEVDGRLEVVVDDNLQER